MSITPFQRIGRIMFCFAFYVRCKWNRVRRTQAVNHSDQVLTGLLKFENERIIRILMTKQNFNLVCGRLYLTMASYSLDVEIDT